MAVMSNENLLLLVFAGVQKSTEPKSYKLSRKAARLVISQLTLAEEY